MAVMGKIRRTSGRTSSVVPANVWSNDLRLPQDNVRDTAALATWLANLLKAHCNSTPA